MILATGVICLFTSLVGYAGIMLNNRVILSIYNLLLWPSFGMIAAIGYTAYRKNKWNIEGKLSYQWHYDLDSDGRARIQANVSIPVLLPTHLRLTMHCFSSSIVVVINPSQIITKDPTNVSLAHYYLVVNSNTKHLPKKRLPSPGLLLSP